jgi:predicted lipoprotein with Yx(FWY)xxD motif
LGEIGVFNGEPVRKPGATMPLNHRFVPVLIVAIGGVAIAGLTGLALAKPSPTLATVKNTTLGKTIVVDSHGLTVYELSPETTHQLLCTKAKGCFKFWPPVTVASAKPKLTAATGVKGKLGVLHRNGLFQVTLAGRPLYRFAGDASKRGEASGQGLHGFGGRWHVVAASGPQPTTSTSTTTATATPTTPYPSY